MTAQKTTMDWLRFRTQAEVLGVLEALRPMFGAQGAWLNLEHLERGKDGFQQAVALRCSQEVIGRIDFGGEFQRGWVRVNITGRGCELVADWDAIEEVESLSASQLRRGDVALTTWRGEIRHEHVLAAHDAGRFTTGGRPPTMRQIISSDPNDGRTIYIGKRDADKFLRCYEKGLELCGKFGLVVDDTTCIDGCPVHGIYRIEAEFKAKDTDLPWELVARRDQYFAGSYPYLADLLPGVEADILMRRPDRAPQMELKAALENCRIQYGATLFTALTCYHGDIGRLLASIVGREHNKTLLAAGVLNVEHES